MLSPTIRLICPYFNPLPPYGGRPTFAPLVQIALSFQSTPSVWRETNIDRALKNPLADFNPLPPYGGRRDFVRSNCRHNIISIHSLRMEGDSWNIHKRPCEKSFQSTPSVWRETICVCWCFRRIVHFNPLPPYGGRPIIERGADIFGNISIHSLRMEGDDICGYNENQFTGISIHSLRMEGDPDRVVFSFFAARKFQSTPSVWRETCLSCRLSRCRSHFNPLPPYGGRPHPERRCKRPHRNFNPLPPYGGRQNAAELEKLDRTFQSTPSVWRETLLS